MRTAIILAIAIFTACVDSPDLDEEPQAVINCTPTKCCVPTPPSGQVCSPADPPPINPGGCQGDACRDPWPPPPPP